MCIRDSPRLVCFTDCPGGKISGLKMINQASWCLHVLYTNGLTIDGIDIRALEYIPSSDGIDIDSVSYTHLDVYKRQGKVSTSVGDYWNKMELTLPSTSTVLQTARHSVYQKIQLKT